MCDQGSDTSVGWHGQGASSTDRVALEVQYRSQYDIINGFAWHMRDAIRSTRTRATAAQANQGEVGIKARMEL